MPWEKYINPDYFSRITLGEFGAELEFSIHNMMHLRWSSQPRNKTIDNPTNADTIDFQYDDRSYNYLADTYSSHVIPIFWKLHGWIEIE